MAVDLTGKIQPKNAAFVGLVDVDQVIDLNTFAASVQTTGASETPLGTVLAMSANAIYNMKVEITAKEDSTLDTCTWIASVSASQAGLITGSKNFEKTVENDSGGASTPADWVIDFDENSNNLRVLVTGEATTTIQWNAIIQYTEAVD